VEIVTSSSTETLSFEGVAEELSNPLRSYLERLAGNRATAEDLLQETLVKIARGLPAFEGRSSVKTWAFSIATRVATDHFRRPASKARIVDFDEAAEPEAPEPDIGDSLVIDEMSACVRGVIDGLPGDYRTALVLHGHRQDPNPPGAPSPQAGSGRRMYVLSRRGQRVSLRPQSMM
jgi:RNA polymerase sigma-70 factor (ECF subfamily)